MSCYANYTHHKQILQAVIYPSMQYKEREVYIPLFWNGISRSILGRGLPPIEINRLYTTGFVIRVFAACVGQAPDRVETKACTSFNRACASPNCEEK